MADEKFIFDSLQDSETITKFLHSLTEEFKKGEIHLATNGDNITLRPEGLLSFTVKAKKKDMTSKLHIKISWKANEPEVDESKPLRVGTNA
jgi:amphi-Trp domain-containing protein